MECVWFGMHAAGLRAIFVKPSEISKRRHISSPISGPSLQVESNVLQLCCNKKKHDVLHWWHAILSYLCSPCRCETDTPKIQQHTVKWHLSEQSAWPGWGARSLLSLPNVKGGCKHTPVWKSTPRHSGICQGCPGASVWGWVMAQLPEHHCSPRTARSRGPTSSAPGAITAGRRQLGTAFALLLSIYVSCLNVIWKPSSPEALFLFWEFAHWLFTLKA